MTRQYVLSAILNLHLCASGAKITVIEHLKVWVMEQGNRVNGWMLKQKKTLANTNGWDASKVFRPGPEELRHPCRYKFKKMGYTLCKVGMVTINQRIKLVAIN